jgi:hypothetical protein
MHGRVDRKSSSTASEIVKSATCVGFGMSSVKFYRIIPPLRKIAFEPNEVLGR